MQIIGITNTRPTTTAVDENKSQPAFDEEQDGKGNKKNKSKEDGEDDGGHVGTFVLGTSLMIVNLDVVVDVDTI